MRGNRSIPWLADHVLFCSYRWLAWCVITLVLWYQGRMAAHTTMLAITGAVNLAGTPLARMFVQLARRNSLILSADIVYCVLVLAGSGGWASPFVFYAYSSLLLPGLLEGLRGWVMSGLSFVSAAAILLWAADRAPAEELAAGGWQHLALILLAPVLVAFSAPWLIERIRQLAARRARSQAQLPPAPRPAHSPSADSPRYSPAGRTATRNRGQIFDDAPLALQLTKTRTTEQSAEDLRRVIFGPLPALEPELAAALDLLVTRFGQHTGIPTTLTLLGRTRLVSPMHCMLLVRLTQEALLNIQQHAHAGTARLTLRYDAGSVVLLIQDDGVGLLDGTHERPGLHALRAMHYRLSEFGGRLDVFETEGGGVTVRATLPLE
ncbi:MAG: histidine kinase [Kouleothrix sp.]|nr:histidine kinase [Kouleothrix sp.]